MREQKIIRVVITDDHRIIREGLRALLDQDEELEVVGEAANGKELLDLLEQTEADVALLDINMPVLDGYATVGLVKERFPQTRVVALSMLNDVPSMQRMIENGATGYVLKNTSYDELTTAIKLAAAGTPFICSGMSVDMLQRFSNQAAIPDGSVAEESSGLSKREMEVLLLIAEGYTNAEIADKLFVSKRTVETHRQNILEKTKAKNTAHLIKYAMEHKLLSS
ncbi:response regulator [Pontibacter roseus]|uniref:response regulator n=1 Tax=Pontibacter roseus TaxID=336989 RepID=UPI000381D879|nr:response regulator transcription factor [Pontibacter roseus]